MDKRERKIPISVSLQSTLPEEDQVEKLPSDKKGILVISLLSVLIAICVSLIAKLLVYLISLITNISFFGNISVVNNSPAANRLGLWVLLIPVAGGIIVGLMAFYGSRAIRGHGIPEAMEQILTNQSKIKPALTFLKPLSSAIAIGTGGPFGAEGPIIATGGALGSTLGQLISISPNERKILLTAGSTAGMAAIFNSPVAAIFLGIELLLFEFSPRSIIPVTLACITGAAGHHILFGSLPVFDMPLAEALPDNTSLAIYSLIGLFIGLVSVGITKAVYWLEDAFEKIPVHWMWWPAIGGLAVGVIGYFSPRTLGVGYNNITDLLSDKIPFYLLAGLCCCKFISWAIALASGTSGGTLAPLFIIGGSLGALVGKIILVYFPSFGITLPICALIGMASMFAGASRAVLTSIIFAIETTDQSKLLLPLLAACGGSYLISFMLMDNTIMTEKISRRGIKTPDSYEPDILDKIPAEAVMEKYGVVLNELDNVQKVQEKLNLEPDSKPRYFIISNDSGEYAGLLNSALLNYQNHSPDTTMRSLLTTRGRYLYGTDSLRVAVRIMAEEEVEVLPVLDPGNKLVIGVLSYQNVISVYKQKMDIHTRGKASISIKRLRLKAIVKGQKLVNSLKIKVD